MSSLSLFDRTVIAVISVLIMSLLITLGIGDRVGVQVHMVAPQLDARSTDTIRIQFSERMQSDAVAERLTITPQVIGAITWIRNTLVFKPQSALMPAEVYQVQLNSGSVAVSGREVLHDMQFNFTVRQPWVAYLAPADQAPQNIWIMDPMHVEASPQQITFSEVGIFDFDVAPNGRQIVYSERRQQLSESSLKLLHLESQTTETLIFCEDVDCNDPVWRPDGSVIAYTRVELNTLLPGIGVSPTRTWLLDLNSRTTRPLFTDSQALGYSAHWSADGQRLTIFDMSVPGIVIHDFQQDHTDAITSQHGTGGKLSPDGSQIAYQDLVFAEGRAYSQLLLADLETQAIQTLTPTDSAVDDESVIWHPSGTHITIGRRYHDARYTVGLQVYHMNLESRDVASLIVDAAYTHGFMSWDASGSQLLMQRFQQLDDLGQMSRGQLPEIWMYHAQTQSLIKLASNAYYPKWIP